jgi:hypothetical protein
MCTQEQEQVKMVSGYSSRIPSGNTQMEYLFQFERILAERERAVAPTIYIPKEIRWQEVGF